MCPDINDLVVTLVVGDETHVVVAQHFFNFSFALQPIYLFLQEYNVTKLNDNHL
jgi:hypothetical protein